jgi:Tol biopolymer transport system component
MEESTMSRAITVLGVLALALGSCGGPGLSPAASHPASGAASSSPGASPTAVIDPSPSTSGDALDPSKVPSGRIAYMRVDADRIERYFTVDSLGENEHALFETKNCACIAWSPDGTKIVTVTETDVALRYTTMDADGTNKVIHTPDIETLSLTPPIGSADGTHLAFFGWDDSEPARLGIWASKADLSDLHQVTGVPDGVVGIDLMGISADGSHAYFHGDTGPSTENEFHHAGNAYSIGTDGKDLRQLNP